jgi:hypothetical protein
VPTPTQCGSWLSVSVQQMWHAVGKGMGVGTVERHISHQVEGPGRLATQSLACRPANQIVQFASHASHERTALSHPQSLPTLKHLHGTLKKLATRDENRTTQETWPGEGCQQLRLLRN